MTAPRVDIFMAVHNGASWLPDVLDSVTAQTYPSVHLTVCDNASTDATPDVLRRYPQATVVRHDGNDGFWAAMERFIAASDAPYIICLTDVVLDPDFTAAAVAAMEANPGIGAVQGKILEQHRAPDGTWVRSGLIDAVGFRIQRSRRVTILGHGEPDDGRYDAPRDIFAVEGAVPVFRRAALEDCRVDGFYATDPAYRSGGITYADDVDLGWRMTLFGWRQVLVPVARGWHDRSTTKGTGGGIIGRLRRRGVRAAIAPEKRRLDWSNLRFTIIKNDHILNVLRDLPWILGWEFLVQGYLLLCEPRTLGAWGRFLRLTPLMLRRRRTVMRRAQLTAAQMRPFFR